MINDQQVRRLKRMLSGGKKLYESALRSGMDEKTARKYRGQIARSNFNVVSFRAVHGKISFPLLLFLNPDTTASIAFFWCV